MAFPTVAATNQGQSINDASPLLINLPAGIQAGDLLLFFLNLAAGRTATTPTGWTFLAGTNPTINGTDRLYGWYRNADGSEGTTLSLTVSADAYSEHITYRITGNASETPPVFAAAVGSSGSANPPNLTPAGGSKDYLWIEVEDGTNATASSGYSNLILQGPGNVYMAAAQKQATASSENPANMGTGTGVWIAWTVAVYPVTAMTGTAASSFKWSDSATVTESFTATSAAGWKFSDSATATEKTHIAGVTKDQGGSVLGSSVVKAYRTSDDVEVASQTSDAATGAFALLVMAELQHYLVAYKTGSPDVAGTTVNTLTGS